VPKKITELILLPGYNGSPNQPLLLKVASAVSSESIVCSRVQPPQRPLDENLSVQCLWLNEILNQSAGKVLLFGRSFGARIAARCANHAKVVGIVLVSFPIRPPNKKRTKDEEALKSIDLPHLIITGTDDELAPKRVIQKCANKKAHLVWLLGAKHSLGTSNEKLAVDHCVTFIQTILT
jgi:uncharacterized protein